MGVVRPHPEGTPSRAPVCSMATVLSRFLPGDPNAASLEPEPERLPEPMSTKPAHVADSFLVTGCASPHSGRGRHATGAEEATMSDTMTTRFAHHRLHVWHHARDLAVQGRKLAAGIPRGDRDLADQLRRSATAPALLIGEGANRLNTGEKRQRFNEARGEACEAAVAAELCAVLGIVPTDEANKLLAVADKVAAMLTGLIRKHSGTP